MAASVNSGPARTRFYIVVALVVLSAAVVGFAKTFFWPLSQGRFHAPPVIFVHGALAFSWVLLFLVQPSLIRRGDYGLHTRLGGVGAVIAVALAVTGVAVGVYATQRDLAAGLGEPAVSNLVGVCTSLAMFLALVTAGVALRARPETHKRLMLLASVLVVWPAWFRFRHYFPGVPRPDIVFALLPLVALILLAMRRDRMVVGRVHPAYLWAGSGLIAEQIAEVALYDTTPWRAVAHAIYDSLT
jgi:hypothetical protein